MDNTIYLNSLYELSEIIKNLSDKIRAKIPNDVINYIEKNKSQNYKWIYNSDLSLDEQNMLPETEELLTAIYRDYICSDAEKEKVNEVLIDNENYIEESNRNVINNEAIEKSVNVDTVAHNYQVREDESIPNSPAIVEKQSFFVKIINKIKSFFSK